MEPYRYRDKDGDVLEIGPHPGAWAVVQVSGDAVYVKPEDVPDVAAKLYEAAGLQSLILERPEIDPDAWLQSGPVRMGLTGDGEVAVAIGNAQSGATPSDIRHIAALLCAYADAAEAEPDPADLEALTELIDAEGVVPGRDLAGRLARSLLRGGVRLEAGS